MTSLATCARPRRSGFTVGVPVPRGFRAVVRLPVPARAYPRPSASPPDAAARSSRSSVLGEFIDLRERALSCGFATSSHCGARLYVDYDRRDPDCTRARKLRPSLSLGVKRRGDINRCAPGEIQTKGVFIATQLNST